MDSLINWDLKILLSLNHFFSGNGGFLNKFFAEYLTYFLPILLLILWFYPLFLKKAQDEKEKIQKGVLRALFSVILAWPILAQIIGRLLNRPRPFDYGEVQELLFHRPTYSFPSDHAATLFAVAFSFYLSGYKKISGLMFLVATIVSFYRVAVGFHWPTDILGGIAIGLISAIIIQFLDKYLDKIYNLKIKFLRKIKLA